jgi:hypothetical protein
MQVANFAERFTTQQARKAVCELTALAPATARVAATAQDRDPHRSRPRRRDRDRATGEQAPSSALSTSGCERGLSEQR